MKERWFRKGMSLLLCAVMIFGVLNFDVHAEEMEGVAEDFVEEGGFDMEDQAEAGPPAPTGLSEQALQAILNRQLGTWKFPVAEEYFDDIVDYVGCRGYSIDDLYRLSNSGCQHTGLHETATAGSDALMIRVDAGQPVYAPVDGTVYYSPYADQDRGDVAVIEQRLYNGYSVYVILGNLGSGAMDSGANVAAGQTIAYTGYGELTMTGVMDQEGKGSKIASDVSWELSGILANGWLVTTSGTGLLCVNPSAYTRTQYSNSLTNQISGPVTYEFVQAAQPQPETTPAPIPTEPGPAPHEHSFTQMVPSDMYLAVPANCQNPAQYYYSCECGDSSTQTFTYGSASDHMWGQPETVVYPTHTTEGQRRTSCMTCGYSVTETIPVSGDHVYQAIPAPQFLAAPASCGSAALYYKSCECGAMSSETFTDGVPSGHTFSPDWSYDDTNHWHIATCEHTSERGDLAPHTWDQGTPMVAPTHVAEGTIAYTCTTCGLTRTETVAPTKDHIYDTVVAPEFLKSQATCTEPAVYYMSCICGAMSSETFSAGEPSGHTYASNWTHNETEHWQAATCVHSNEKGNVGPHDWDDGRITQDAGHAKDGVKVYTCRTCGAEKSETLPGQPHVFTQQVVSEKYMKSAATCTEPAVYYMSCECGLKGDTTFAFGGYVDHSPSGKWNHDDNYHWSTCTRCNARVNQAAHIWDPGVVTVQPTAYSKGVKTYTCFCGRTRQEDIPATQHVHTYSTQWAGNNTYHWHPATCEHTSEVRDVGVHNWNGGVYTSGGSHTSGGYKTFTCLTCGMTKQEATADQHVYDRQIIGDAYLKSGATCTSPAVYYKSCTCGARGTETFVYGNALGHTSNGSWGKDANYHWSTCSRCGARGNLAAHTFGQSDKCSTCGYSKMDSHVHSSHLKRYAEKYATCTQPGNKAYYVCECGKWFSDVTTTVEITDQQSVIIPATGHVDKDNNGRCDVCKERIATDTVTYQLTEGADTTWLTSSNAGLVFRSNAEFSKFDHVEVDGATISSLNYKTSSGSTIVELSANYLKKLTPGYHTITIASKDGKATGGFTVKQGAATNQNSGSKSSSSVIWIVVIAILVIIAIAIPCVVGYFYYNKKSSGGRYSR